MSGLVANEMSGFTRWSKQAGEEQWTHPFRSRNGRNTVTAHSPGSSRSREIGDRAVPHSGNGQRQAMSEKQDRFLSKGFRMVLEACFQTGVIAVRQASLNYFGAFIRDLRIAFHTWPHDRYVTWFIWIYVPV